MPTTVRSPAEPIWAGVPEPRIPTRPLRDGEVADLAIVGGGILGFTTALTAARAGLSVRLFEAGPIGAGRPPSTADR